MGKKILAIILLATFLFSTTAYADQYKFSFPEKLVLESDRSLKNPPASMPRIDTISQEEYDRKMRSAKHLKTAGYILFGITGAFDVGGFTLLIIGGSSKKKFSESLSYLSGGLLMMLGGCILAIPTAITLGIGKHREKKLKNMQISLSPTIEPQQDRFGMALSANF